MKSRIFLDADLLFDSILSKYPERLEQMSYVKEFLAKLRPHIAGLKLGDAIDEHGVRTVFKHPLNSVAVFVDEKRHDTADRVERRVARYARLGSYTPKYFTVSGDMSLEALKRVAAVRGDMHILLVPVLSDWTEEDCCYNYSMSAASVLFWRVHKAKEAGLQGITCPAYLLPALGNAQDLEVMVTGVVSDNAAAHNHKNPRPPRFVLKHRMHNIVGLVAGREVTGAPDPIAALVSINAECQAASAA